MSFLFKNKCMLKLSRDGQVMNKLAVCLVILILFSSYISTYLISLLSVFACACKSYISRELGYCYLKMKLMY